MTLIAACASKDAIIIASDSLVGNWEGCSFCPPGRNDQQKIFPIGQCLVGYAGHEVWANQIIAKALAENSIQNDAHALAIDLSRIGIQHVAEARRISIERQGRISKSCPPENEASVDFLVCGITAQLPNNGPICYHVSSRDNFFGLPYSKCKFIGSYPEYQALFSTLYHEDMSSEKISKLLNYCLYEAIGKSDKRFVDFPVHIWVAPTSGKPFQLTKSTADLDTMHSDVAALIRDFRNKL